MAPTTAATSRPGTAISAALRELSEQFTKAAPCEVLALFPSWSSELPRIVLGQTAEELQARAVGQNWSRTLSNIAGQYIL